MEDLKEKLEAIAGSMRALGGAYHRVGLDIEFVDRLAAIGVPLRATVYSRSPDGGGPYVIVSAELVITGVEFHAQRSREATAEEIAALEAPTHRHARDEFVTRTTFAEARKAS